MIEHLDDEFSDRMRAIKEEFGGDFEEAHCLADALLCEVLRKEGYNQLVDLFIDIDKWYA